MAFHIVGAVRRICHVGQSSFRLSSGLASVLSKLDAENVCVTLVKGIDQTMPPHELTSDRHHASLQACLALACGGATAAVQHCPWLCATFQPTLVSWLSSGSASTQVHAQWAHPGSVTESKFDRDAPGSRTVAEKPRKTRTRDNATLRPKRDHFAGPLFGAGAISRSSPIP